ncbi:MAG: hypothetical protein IKB97_04025 [Bacteroidaceae bacterium]|nr:hypothetical protein [Bacteroidaceae bacterium]
MEKNAGGAKFFFGVTKVLAAFTKFFLIKAEEKLRAAEEMGEKSHFLCSE